MFFTANHLKHWMTSMKTQLGRIKKLKKGKSGQGTVHLSDRQHYLWTNMKFLLSQIKGRTYKELLVVGICIQLLTCYGHILIRPPLLCIPFLPFLRPSSYVQLAVSM